MNNISSTYKSLALAQEKLWQMRYGDFALGTIFGRIQANHCKDTMSNISTIRDSKSNLEIFITNFSSNTTEAL